MKEIRLCDDTEVNRVLDLCINNNLGIEIQGFYNPKLIDTEETNVLINEYTENLLNFKGGKSLHAPF